MAIPNKHSTVTSQPKLFFSLLPHSSSSFFFQHDADVWRCAGFYINLKCIIFCFALLFLLILTVDFEMWRLHVVVRAKTKHKFVQLVENKLEERIFLTKKTKHKQENIFRVYFYISLFLV